MPSPLTIPIGRNSQNEVQHIKISGGKQLFVSYTSAGQLATMIHVLTRLIEAEPTVTFIAAMHSKNSRLLNGLINGRPLDLHFFDQPEAGTIKTRRAYIGRLYKLFKSRMKNYEQQEPYAPCIAFIDDIWSLIGKVTKQMGEQFLELLHDSHKANIILVISSPRSYRNLMDNLVNKNDNSNGTLGMTANGGLYQMGAEVIYTPDDLVFYRPINSMEVRHFYKL